MTLAPEKPRRGTRRRGLPSLLRGCVALVVAVLAGPASLPFSMPRTWTLQSATVDRSAGPLTPATSSMDYIDNAPRDRAGRMPRLAGTSGAVRQSGNGNAIPSTRHFGWLLPAAAQLAEDESVWRTDAGTTYREAGHRRQASRAKAKPALAPVLRPTNLGNNPVPQPVKKTTSRAPPTTTRISTTRSNTRTTTSSTTTSRTTTATPTTSATPVNVVPPTGPPTVVPGTPPPGIILDSANCVYLPIPGANPLLRSVQFNIDVVSCATDHSYDSFLVDAASKWMQIITGDIPDYNRNPYFSPLVLEGTDKKPIVRATSVDDLVVVFYIKSDDGPGGRYASAQQSWLRTKSGLPFAGSITLDSADVAGLATSKLLGQVLMHEMGHVIGFGLSWTTSPMDLLQPYDCEDRADANRKFDASFKGTNAKNQLASIGSTTGSSKPVVESSGSAACVHWSESVYGNELMTGFIAPGSNPLSVLTVASFQDMGYQVNYNALPVDWSYRRPSGTGRAAVPDGAIQLSGCLDHAHARTPQFA